MVRKLTRERKVLSMNHRMPLVISEESQCDARLAELSLDRRSLISAGEYALRALSSAQPLHPSNTAGTLAYFDGVLGLRSELIGEEWKFFRSEGMEGIVNERLKLKVFFANVLVACTKETPKARSRKGPGAERVSGSADLFSLNGIDMPITVPQSTTPYQTYFLMVDVSGSMELSRPIISRGNFLRCEERIFLRYGLELDIDDIDLHGPDDDYDVVVTRKRK